MILENERSDKGPAAHGMMWGKPFLSWRGKPNKRLNVIYSEDGGSSFRGKLTMNERTSCAPALAFVPEVQSDSGGVSTPATGVLAWAGVDGVLHLATMNIATRRRGSAVEEGTSCTRPVALEEMSEHGPALANSGSQLFLAWTARGDRSLNLVDLQVEAATADVTPRLRTGRKVTFNQQSLAAPAMVEHGGNLYLAWTGTDNHLNVGRILIISRPNSELTARIGESVTLVERSDSAPAVSSVGDRLWLAWKGFRNADLNLMYSTDNGATFRDKQLVGEASRFAPALSEVPTPGGNFGLLVAWTGTDGRLNVRV
ncbi:hypothetical protein [Mycolicibacterium peregrinum]|uniref:hypothetical protein n=1 Tax=Mycolicibacterium peregrinum TaxID=43304 RepID=UPI003AAD342E